MIKFFCSLAVAGLGTAVTPAFADQKGSSGRQHQTKGTQQIPISTKNLGTIAIVDPDNQWWRDCT